MAQSANLSVYPSAKRVKFRRPVHGIPLAPTIAAWRRSGWPLWPLLSSNGRPAPGRTPGPSRRGARTSAKRTMLAPSLFAAQNSESAMFGLWPALLPPPPCLREGEEALSKIQPFLLSPPMARPGPGFPGSGFHLQLAFSAAQETFPAAPPVSEKNTTFKSAKAVGDSSPGKF